MIVCGLVYGHKDMYFVPVCLPFFKIPLNFVPTNANRKSVRHRNYEHRPPDIGLEAPFHLAAPFPPPAGIRELKREKGSDWLYEPPKLKRLLFRLVNYARPETIVDAGRLSASSLYLKAARVGADYVGAADLSELFLEADVPVDFLYLHDYRHPDFVQQVFEVCVARTTGRSLFVIEGVRYTPEMTALWKRLRKHERVGVTFDLYDLGILFFDKSKAKQDYIVNYSHPFSL